MTSFVLPSIFHEACQLLLDVMFVSDMTGDIELIVSLSISQFSRDPSIIKMDSLHMLSLLFAFQPPLEFLNTHNYW